MAGLIDLLLLVALGLWISKMLGIDFSKKETREAFSELINNKNEDK